MQAQQPRPQGTNKIGCAVPLLVTFGCLFVYAILYFATGILLAGEAQSLYASKDCARLITLASATTKIFPESIVPASKPARLEMEECAVFQRAQEKYKQTTWAEAYKDFDRYLSNYPSGIFVEDARNFAADSLYRLARDQQANRDFAGAEANLLLLQNKFAANTQPSQTEQALAEVYIEWAAALESSKDFSGAEKKYNLAIQADPNPSSAGGPAERAKTALPELHRKWGQSLLAEKKFKDAVGHLKTAIQLLGPGKSGPVSDELAQAYLLWAKSQSASNDHFGALETINLAEQAAASPSTKDAAGTARASALDTFSKSSGPQSRELMEQAAKTVCTNKTAATPSVPILGIQPDGKRALLYGLNFTLSNSVWADNPGTAYYVACVTVNEKTVQSCPYTGGYSIKRVSTDWVVELRTLLTGKIYQQTTLRGGSPESCPYVHSFTIGVYTATHKGSPPAQSALETWLARFIK